LEKWILSFNLYENWAGRGKCIKLSLLGKENVRGKLSVGICPGENVRLPVVYDVTHADYCVQMRVERRRLW